MFQSLFQTKNERKNSQTPKSRKLRLEALENRELLSVAPWETAAEPASEAAVVAETISASPVVDLSALNIGAEPISAAPVDSDAETPSLTVTSNLDVVDETDGVITLREAIQYAEADSSLGSTITFDPSLKGETITLSGTQLQISQGITVDASALLNADGTPGITVDANKASRVFYVNGGTAETPVELIGLTITGGKVNSHGGGVYVYPESVASFTNCAITGNTASRTTAALYGGGVYVDANATTTFTNVTISGNAAKGSGSYDAYGGGMSVVGSATFTNSTISDNSATSGEKARGGGVCIHGGGTATFTNSTISGNTASYGGGVWAMDCYPTTFTNCTISGNTARSGGGFYHRSGGETGGTTFTNSIISGNTASYGGVYVEYDAVTFTNVTISGNTASYGGGVYVYKNNSSSATLYNSIVALNAATTSGADVYDLKTVNAYNTLSSYSAWDNASETGVVNYVYDASQPLFKDAENGDYTLAANSQALNKGNNAYAVDADGNALTTDLAGNPRISDGTVDLGAYEYQQLATPTLSVSGTTSSSITVTIGAVANASSYTLE